MSRKNRTALINTASTLLTILIALALGAILVVLSENNAGTAYAAILRGAFGSRQKISELFVKLVPILMMGFGISIAYKAQLWNIGGAGQFTMGSISSMAVALYVPLPYVLRIPLCMLTAIAAGALWAALAGWLKNRFNANEVISTLMLSHIANYFLLYLINGPMHDPYSDLSQSDIIPEEMRLIRLFGSNYRVNFGLILLIIAIIFMLFFWRTVTGYRINLIGQGEKVSTYAGVNAKRTVIVTMLISGGFCGLAGWIELFGLQFRLLDGIASNYGDIATIVALLGSLNPAGIIAASAFFSVLICGGASMQRMTSVPYSVVDAIQGLIIIFVIAKASFSERIDAAVSKLTRKRKETETDAE